MTPEEKYLKAVKRWIDRGTWLMGRMAEVLEDDPARVPLYRDALAEHIANCPVAGLEEVKSAPSPGLRSTDGLTAEDFRRLASPYGKVGDCKGQTPETGP